MYSLCCISNELKPNHSFKTMTWKRFNDLGAGNAALKELSARWLNNIKVTHRIIQHCANNDWNYRVSSSLFPILTHPDFPYNFHNAPDHQQILSEFRAIQDARYPVRLSCHPDQFNVLASRNESSLAKTKNELECHGWMMDLLGCERSYQNPINIHVNCSDGEPWEIADRFAANLATLSDSVRSRLVVENEDKSIWTVEHLIKHFYNRHGIPITYDNLHDKCNPSDAGIYDCVATWGKYKPLFHYSESHPTKPNPRSHADMPTDFPSHYISASETLSYNVDWEVELKSKDLAVRELERICKEGIINIDKYPKTLNNKV
jgi:UV DNA damage endonuclease